MEHHLTPQEYVETPRKEVGTSLTLLHPVPFTPGQCFADCLEIMLQNENVDWLVHGVATGTKGEIKGKRFAHAWVEIEALDIVWVSDAHRQSTPVPRAIYYAVGQINPADCKRYDRMEAGIHALESNHSGPWHDFGKDVL